MGEKSDTVWEIKSKITTYILNPGEPKKGGTGVPHFPGKVQNKPGPAAGLWPLAA